MIVIFEFFNYFVIVYFTIVINKSLLNNPQPKKRQIAFALAMLSILILRFCPIPQDIKATINAVLSVLFTLLILYGGIWKKMLSFLIFFLATVICDGIFAFFIIRLVPTNLAQLDSYTTAIYAVIVSLLTIGLVYLVIWCKNHINFKKLYLFSQKHYVSIFTIMIGFAFLTMLYSVNRLSSSLENETMFLLPVLGIPIAISILLLLYAIDKSRKEKMQKEQLMELQKQLYTLYDSTRTFRHQYFNNLIALDGYSRSNDSADMQKYIAELLKEYINTMQSSNTFDIYNIQDDGLKALLVFKAHMATVQNNIKFDIFADKINDYRFLQNDLIDVFSILCDNSIEAAKLCDQPFVALKIFEQDGMFCLNIQNSTHDKVEVSRIFEKGYTTKSAGSGIGLYHLKKILAKYSNSIINVESTQNTITFQVFL